MSRTLLLAGAAAGLLLGAPGTRAADVTPAQAASLENQVRDWLGSLVGPAMKLGDRPVSITAAGDHYDVVVPIPLPAAVPGTAYRFTGAARAIEGGKWTVENVRAAMPMTFTLDMPAPRAAPKAPPSTVPVKYTVDVKGQDGRIVWDPSFATPSTWNSSAQGATMRTEGGPVSQDSSFGAITSLGTLRPAGADRVDVLSEGTLQDYKAKIGTDAAGVTDVGMKRIRVNVALNGVSRTKALVILQAVTTVGMAANQAQGRPPKLGQEVMRSMLDALQDFASDFSLDETIDGLAVQIQGMAALLDRMKLGLAAKSTKGLLEASMDLGVEGLSLPDLPLGGLEALIPHRVALRPVVSGIGVAELTSMAKASSEGRAVTPEDIKALFSHGGIKAGLDSLAIEIGGAVISGQGKMVMTSPEAFSGDAQIVAENLDALMQKVSAIPAAAQAVPVLLMAKGIGKAVGNKVIWDVSYHDGKMLVNNVDLAAMAGGGAPPPNRPNQQRPAPNRPNR